MGKKIAYVGIDYHLKSVPIAVIVEGENDYHQTIRLPNKGKALLKI